MNSVNDDAQFGYTFVGRELEMDEVLKRWEKCRIFGIYGQPAVGKTKFAERVLQNVDTWYRKERSVARCLPPGKTSNSEIDRTDNDKIVPLYVARVDLTGVQSALQIIERFNLATKFPTSFNYHDPFDEASQFNWKHDLAAHIKNHFDKVCKRYVILIDNCEHVVVADEKNFTESKLQNDLTAGTKEDTDADPDYLHQDRPIQTLLLNLIGDLVKQCQNLWVLLVSKYSFNFASLGRVYHPVRLSRLTTEEGGSLLQEVCDSVKFRNDQLEELVEKCEGVPLHIIVVGTELNGSEHLYKAGGLLEVLREDRLRSLGEEGLTDDERAEKIEAKEFSRLPPKLQKNALSLVNLQNGCSKEDMAARTGYTSTPMAMRNVGAPLIRRGKADCNPNNEKIALLPFTEEFVANRTGQKLPKKLAENSANENYSKESKTSSLPQVTEANPSVTYHQTHTSEVEAIGTTVQVTKSKQESAPKTSDKKTKRSKLTVAERLEQSVRPKTASIKTPLHCAKAGPMLFPNYPSSLKERYVTNPYLNTRCCLSDTESVVSDVRLPGTYNELDTQLRKCEDYEQRSETNPVNFSSPLEWNILPDISRPGGTGPSSCDDNNDGYSDLSTHVDFFGPKLMADGGLNNSFSSTDSNQTPRKELV
ncbi:uncharacterized protein LOC106165845 [Lingula anatina]|uniref:Uncharacterized protein LOC106165845 n=1 Tax=Lingula anatina TaxID=7574 RepID=A0A1S3IP35_LINAN|nr:uncharacterized protein LOC106165845 [Lingula anatina]|eukprot:XP_013399666.1 uncharacterized protein LOC106165845 [Lingula anatina]